MVLARPASPPGAAYTATACVFKVFNTLARLLVLVTPAPSVIPCCDRDLPHSCACSCARPPSRPSGTVTRVLSLRGCTGVNGTGLKSLRDPHTVLERIDLRIGPRDHLTPGPTELDDVEVVSTLQDLLDQPNNALQAILFRRPRKRENFWEEMDEQAC